MNNSIRYIGVFICLVGIVFIRFRESVLFYDPLLQFFKGSYAQASLPDLELGRFFMATFLRFLVNTLLSLAIIGFLFKQSSAIKLSAFLYAVVGVLCFILLYVAIQNYEIGESMFLFYTRRFLIQPLLLFILVPAFYYHKKHSK